MPTASEDYQRIAAAINFIAENRLEQPELATVAAAVGLSKYHFQRLFVRWAGISPKQFLAHLTVGHAKELLRQGESVLHASLDTGLSGPGRLHDLFVGVEAMTPGDYKRFGADLMIRYGLQQTPFGDALVLLTERGVCGYEIVDDSDGATAVKMLELYKAHGIPYLGDRIIEPSKRTIQASGSIRLQIVGWPLGISSSQR